MTPPNGVTLGVSSFDPPKMLLLSLKPPKTAFAVTLPPKAGSSVFEPKISFFVPKGSSALAPKAPPKSVFLAPNAGVSSFLTPKPNGSSFFAPKPLFRGFRENYRTVIFLRFLCSFLT